MRDIIIAPQQEGKGRSFSATCLATIEADRLWSGGGTDNMRPVWSMFAGSEQELRPFVMNLRSGRKGVFIKSNGYTRSKDEKLEFLKSCGFETTWQREVEGSIATVFLPELFQMDPGMVEVAGANFIVLHTKEWANRQSIDINPLVRHVRDMIPKNREGEPYLPSDSLAELVPSAFLFSAYLDRRTRCPLLSDARFYLQLLVACLTEGLASLPRASGSYYNSYDRKEFGINGFFGFETQGLDDLGFATPIAFSAGHSEIERVLAEQVTLFFQKTGGR